MSLKIRLLESTDLVDVVKISSQFPHNSWSHKVFADCLKAQYAGFVLEKEAVVIGFVIGLVHDNECQLMNIGVEQSLWRQGYGAKLLDHLIQYCKSHQVNRILLEVRASNESAIRLYEAKGFTQLGIRKNYYPAGNQREDAVIYFLPC